MAINYRQTIDESPIAPLQWFVAITLTLVLFLEGIDFQIAAFSAPPLMKLWHLGKPQMAPLIAAASIGMAIGTLIGSWTGDRYGRKPTLFVAVAFFGTMTLVCATATTPQNFILYRFIGGLGFGAAFPVATAMMGEWMPRRVAGRAISIMTTGIPGGIVVGALIASWVLPHYGWRVFFVGVGVACLLAVGAVLWRLPESPSFLIVKGRHQDAHNLLARIWNRPFGDGSEAFQVEAKPVAGSGLFSKSNTRLNLGLWLAYLCASLITYTMSAWLTVIFVDMKLPLATALRGPLTYSLSAIVGALTVGWLIEWLGSRPTMLILGGLALASAICMSIAGSALVPGAVLLSTTFVGLAVAGYCIGGLIAATLVIAARAYDTSFRARGIGVVYAIGRVGVILSSFIGAAVLAAGHQSGFFALVAALVSVVLVGGLIINRHIAPTTDDVVS